MSRIFISYRREDSAGEAGRIYDYLEQKLGREAVLFKDVDTIAFGDNFRDFINNAVAQCQFLLAIIGRRWLTVEDTSGRRQLNNPADWVRLEIETAFQQGVRVIPVLLDGAEMPAMEDLPESLQPLCMRNAARVRHDPDFRRDIEHLLRVIERHLEITDQRKTGRLVNRQRQIAVTIEQKDVLAISGDVLALKYADDFYGADEAVAQALLKSGTDIRQQVPALGKAQLFDTHSVLNVDQVMFIGVGNLYQFQYQKIREFSQAVLSALESSASTVRRLVMTLHGVGYGLDEIEVLRSEIAGFVDAIESGHYPEGLETIVIAERNSARAARLQLELLDVSLDLSIEGGIPVPGFSDLIPSEPVASEQLKSAGYDSNKKANVFVAMPFAEDFDDVYHYGIQGAVRESGFLCERADRSAFTGDVMDWVKQRIESAALVIADLTGANANVYLEVGYAWGRNRPTVLLVNEAEELKFDVRGQRCIQYKKIKDLEEQLTQELKQLKQSSSNVNS